MRSILQNERIKIRGPFIPRMEEVWAAGGAFRKPVAEMTQSNETHPVDVEAEPGRKHEAPALGQMALPGLGSYDPSSIRYRRFTFDQFVVGPCNRFAYEAARAVAKTKPSVYNPLYLYGGSGLGKSNLCGAIGNHIHRNEPTTRIISITAEEFVKALATP